MLVVYSRVHTLQSTQEYVQYENNYAYYERIIHNNTMDTSQYIATSQSSVHHIIITLEYAYQLASIIMILSTPRVCIILQLLEYVWILQRVAQGLSLSVIKSTQTNPYMYTSGYEYILASNVPKIMKKLLAPFAFLHVVYAKYEYSRTNCILCMCIIYQLRLVEYILCTIYAYTLASRTPE